MSAVRSGILASAADRYASQALSIATLAVMSRILTPAEIGLFVVANAFIMLADNFRAFGTGTYIVQVQDLTPEVLRSAFTVTLLFSVGIFCAIFAASDLIAAFYGDAAIGGLLRLAAAGFLLIPFATPQLALLQREMRFRRLAVLNVSAAACNSAVTIALGALGRGPVSYVWGALASSAMLTALVLAMRPERGLFQLSLKRARPILSFGMVSSGVTVVNLAYDLLPRLAFGKILSFEAVGLYARAVTVCQLPDRTVTSALQPVVLPALAAHARAGGDLRASYLRGHALMSGVQWPMLVMLALLADPVVRILLGAQWVEAAPLVRMIALAMMTLAPAFMTFPVLVASGRIRDSLWASLISLPPSMLIMIGASTIGLEAVAASTFVVAPLQMGVAFAFIRRALDLSWHDMIIASRDSFALALGTAVVPGLILAASADGMTLTWMQTAAALAGGAAGWLMMLVILRHPIGAEVAAVLRMVLPPRRKRNAEAAE